MQFQPRIDLGQVLLITIGICVGAISWFLKKEIMIFGARLDKHEEVILKWTNTISVVVGNVDMMIKLLGDTVAKKLKE